MESQDIRRFERFIGINEIDVRGGVDDAVDFARKRFIGRVGKPEPWQNDVAGNDVDTLFPSRSPFLAFRPKLVFSQLLLDAAVAACSLFRADQAVHVRVAGLKYFAENVGAEEPGSSRKQNVPDFGSRSKRQAARRSNMQRQFGFALQEPHALLAPFGVARTFLIAAICATCRQTSQFVDQEPKTSSAWVPRRSHAG